MNHRAKTTFITSIGSALEYYDFVIYAMLTYYTSLVFFPTAQETARLLQATMIFSVGYLARPIGGLIFGYLGDHYGRKSALTATIMLMSISTLCIGLLPSYSQLGVLSPLLLILFRLTQGISQGAELPGAITFISEHADKTRRGLLCGFIFLGISIGTMLASFIIYLLTSSLDQQQMTSWGWRIPFLLGGGLAYIGYLLRRDTAETELFLDQTIHPHRGQWLKLLRHHPVTLLQGIFMTLLAACLVIFTLFFPLYLQRFFTYPASSIYLAITVGLLWASFLIPLFGALSDRITRKKLLLLAAAITSISIYPLFTLLNGQHLWNLFLFILLYQTLIAACAACYPTMLAELFPTHLRYTGVALAYNIAYTLAALFPILTTYLLSKQQSFEVISLLFSLLALLCMIATFTHKDKTRQHLPRT